MKTATRNYHPKIVSNLNNLTDKLLDCFNVENPLKDKSTSANELAYMIGLTNKVTSIRDACECGGIKLPESDFCKECI